MTLLALKVFAPASMALAMVVATAPCAHAQSRLSQQSDAAEQRSAMGSNTNITFDKKDLMRSETDARRAKAEKTYGPDLVTPVLAPFGYVVRPVEDAMHAIDAALLPVSLFMEPLTGPVRFPPRARDSKPEVHPMVAK